MLTIDESVSSSPERHTGQQSWFCYATSKTTGKINKLQCHSFAINTEEYNIHMFTSSVQYAV